MGRKRLFRTVIITEIVDFLLLLIAFLYWGRDSYSKFFNNEFVNYNFQSCVDVCISDILLVSLGRIALLILIYPVGKFASWAPHLAISLVVTAAFGAELTYILLKSHVTHDVVIKLSLLGASIAFTWIIFSAAMYAKFGKKIGSRRNSYSTLGHTFEVRSRSLPGSLHNSYKTFKDDNLIPKKTEVTPLLSESWEKSALFKPSSSEERYRKTYSINSFGGQPTTALPEYAPSDSSPDNRSNTRVIPSLPRVVGLMVDDKTGLRLYDHVIKKNVYRNCFSGREAVDWLLATWRERVPTRVEAVAILQKLLEEGYLDVLEGKDTFRDDESFLATFSNDIERLPVVRTLQFPAVVRSYEDPEKVRKEEEERLLRQQERIQREEMEKKQRLEEERLRKIKEEEDKIREEEDRKRAEEEKIRKAEEEERMKIEEQARKEREAKEAEARQKLEEAIAQRRAEELRLEEEERLRKEQQEKTGEQKVVKVSPLMRNFVKEMRDPASGVSIKDRQYHLSATEFTTFQRCFVGIEFVDWLIKNKELAEREHAVKIGQKMMAAGLFHHVTDKLPFLDGYYFYRFKEDD